MCYHRRLFGDHPEGGFSGIGSPSRVQSMSVATPVRIVVGPTSAIVPAEFPNSTNLTAVSGTLRYGVSVLATPFIATPHRPSGNT